MVVLVDDIPLPLLLFIFIRLTTAFVTGFVVLKCSSQGRVKITNDCCANATVGWLTTQKTDNEALRCCSPRDAERVIAAG